ncbi:hypothetical protein SAMN05192543_104303 [Paraburkholderia megapolitana]|uniref:Uncharacterized protein n=1 Tax=Paraburkholderia megapolitana TaxID=420953 RepID=A0A1I3L9J3_9BURK|nr:hypothetical protein SAMN05192543_104303 [Paraburkholderia megapolitana]
MNSWLPLIASVLLAVTWPAATLVICRSKPGEPTLTTPTGDVPANGPSCSEPIVAVAVATAPAVIEPEPRATELAIDAVAPLPSATEPLPEAVAPLPTAALLVPDASAFVPAASALRPVAPSLL